MCVKLDAPECVLILTHLNVCDVVEEVDLSVNFVRQQKEITAMFMYEVKQRWDTWVPMITARRYDGVTKDWQWQQLRLDIGFKLKGLLRNR